MGLLSHLRVSLLSSHNDPRRRVAAWQVTLVNDELEVFARVGHT